jgi:hypothetical protein
MITTNSIGIPESFVELCDDCHEETDCTLYAIALSGGLTTGTTCPGGCDSDEEWYLALWHELRDDIDCALVKARLGCATCNDVAGLVAFQAWVNWQTGRLEESYGLSDWVGCFLSDYADAINYYP